MATATEMAMATAMEDEECNGCDGADPQHCLDDSLLRLADVRLITTTTVGATAQRWWSPATTTMSMPMIDIGTLFIGREDREGDDGSGIAREDVDDADTEAGENVRDFLEVVLCQLWEGRFGRRRTTTKTTETSSDNEHQEDFVTRSMSPSLSLSMACPKRRSPQRGLSGVIIWYSGLVWTCIMHEGPLAIYW